ncbi:CoA-binding protein [Actinomadura sp. KC345]|uniref:acetate--CoA ligase family protein n=1 Tax=Actinomadura sp. KC345 TaxID=2530371 RepID=UPI0010508AFE|nr:acetate--CoA ligase family protein [Actinomadura sp. KC345]TDC55934.1 CoA-binding protein [Actinomadura sp. KC345]
MTQSASATSERSTSLDQLVAPSSIAVVGASDQPARIGGRILARLKESYGGTVFPVNPSRATVQGLAAYPDMASVPEPVDLAIVAAQAGAVPEIARQAADRGTGALLVLSAGFGELGGEGARAQEGLAATAGSSGMRLVGPNCIGILNLNVGLRAVFSTIDDIPQRPGNIGVVSQSGGFGMRIFEAAQASGLGVSYVLATGNEADVTSGELLGHLVEQPDVDVVALFMESVNKPEALLAAGRRALELDKPVVAVRTGRSLVGARAAASHTGALASADDVVGAAFDSVGIVRVNGLAELVEYSRLFAARRRPAGRRLAVVTSSGGAGVVMADAAEAAGLDMPVPSAPLRASLGSLVPPFGSIANPFDPTAQIVNDQSMLHALFTEVAAAPDYDMVCLAGAPRGLGKTFLDTVVTAVHATDKPFTVWAAQPDVARDLTEQGVVACGDPDLLIRAMGALARYRENREPLLSSPARPPSRAPAVQDARTVTLAEHLSRRLLVEAGIAVPDERVAGDADEAVEAAAVLGGPVVLKLSAGWLAHKSELGAVRVGLTDPEAVRSAFAELTALASRSRPEGKDAAVVLVQAMADRGLELVLGGFTDPQFGPVVTIGLGGTLVEIVRERRLALAPVAPAAAERLIRGLAGGRLVGHPRGLTEEQASRVGAVMSGLGDLMAERPQIRELEVNPLIVGSAGAVAVDALAVVDRAAARAGEVGAC